MAELVTLFGGGGFIGRYVAQALMRQGVRVRIVGRDPRRAWFVKPLGALGQTQFLAADVTKPHTVSRAIRGADAVVNLVGVLNGNFQAVHVEGARNVAEAAKAEGAGALVHLSAVTASPNAPSAYGRSKAEGEEAVRAAYPNATIIRPAAVFGPEDDFVNRLAAMMQYSPVMPIAAPGTRFQPVFVADVAQAIAAAALDPGRYGGRTFELAGPEVLTMTELVHCVARMTGRNPAFLELPDSLAGLVARLGFLPGAPLTMRQWEMLRQDSVASPGAEGLAAFGLHATPLETAAPRWLVRYRRHGRFGAERKAL